MQNDIAEEVSVDIMTVDGDTEEAFSNSDNSVTSECNQLDKSVGGCEEGSTNCQLEQTDGEVTISHHSPCGDSEANNPIENSEEGDWNVCKEAENDHEEMAENECSPMTASNDITAVLASSGILESDCPSVTSIIDDTGVITEGNDFSPSATTSDDDTTLGSKYKKQLVNQVSLYIKILLCLKGWNLNRMSLMYIDHTLS